MYFPFDFFCHFHVHASVSLLHRCTRVHASVSLLHWCTRVHASVSLLHRCTRVRSHKKRLFFYISYLPYLVIHLSTFIIRSYRCCKLTSARWLSFPCRWEFMIIPITFPFAYHSICFRLISLQFYVHLRGIKLFMISLAM